MRAANRSKRLRNPRLRTGQLAEPDQASGSATLSVAPEVAARVDSTARGFVEQLIEAPIGSAAFARAVRAIDQIGDREIRATAEIAARFSDRPVSAIHDILDEDSPLARQVGAVRELAALFARQRDEPRPSDRKRIAAEVGRSEERLRALVESLDANRTALLGDNARLAQQEQALFAEIQKLRQYALLASRVEGLLEERIGTLAETQPDAAHVIETEVAYIIRQRRRDLLLQLAVASQAYASLRLIEQNNLEVVWALRTAATTTVTALRTAGLAARALLDRRVAAGPLSELQADDGPWADLLRSLDDVDARRRRTLSQIKAAPGPRFG